MLLNVLKTLNTSFARSRAFFASQTKRVETRLLKLFVDTDLEEMKQLQPMAMILYVVFAKHYINLAVFGFHLRINVHFKCLCFDLSIIMLQLMCFTVCRFLSEWCVS